MYTEIERKVRKKISEELKAEMVAGIHKKLDVEDEV